MKKGRVILNIKRYFNSLLLASVFYSFLIITLLYSFDETTIAPSQNQHSKQDVKFTLISLPKQIEKPPVEKKEIVKKEAKPQPQKKKIEKKVVKKINPKKISPKKIVKKVEQKKKTITKTKEIVKKIVEKKIQKPIQQIVANQIKQQKTPIKKETVQTDTKQLVIKQNKYYTKIKQTIDKNKSYPKVAVRRGIQGEVKIQFTISKSGELLSYKILDGKKIFLKSISEAIKNSFPLTPPNDIFTSNLDLKLTLQYKLY